VGRLARPGPRRRVLIGVRHAPCAPPWSPDRGGGRYLQTMVRLRNGYFINAQLYFGLAARPHPD
jgi:hypothetical protein